MSTCTGLAGQCVTGDYSWHETARITVPGGELYVAEYLNSRPQLVLQLGDAVRFLGVAEALRVAGSSAPLLRPLLLLLLGEAVAA
jgi:hypothetical protein